MVSFFYLERGEKNMDGIFIRLGMADAEQSRLIINPPADYEALLKENGLAYDTDVEQDSYDVIQIFGTANEEIMQFASLYIDFLNETGVIWLSYPKKTSKKYRNSVCNH